MGLRLSEAHRVGKSEKHIVGLVISQDLSAIKKKNKSDTILDLNNIPVQTGKQGFWSCQTITLPSCQLVFTEAFN